MKLPADTELAIVDRYRNGATMAAVAAAEHVSVSTVHRVLRRRGVPARGHGRRQLAHARYLETIRLYESGLGGEDVGRLLGITGAAVRQRLRLAGVPRRAGGEPPRRLKRS